jgi:hypothetical protein
VKKELVAAIRVFLPTSQFVVDSKRDALLEAITSPCGESDDVAVYLEAERHVEILGNVGFGPKFLVAVFVEV